MLKSILLSTIVATTIISLSGCTMTINAGNYNKELKDANAVFSSIDTRNVSIEYEMGQQIVIGTEDLSKDNLNKIINVFSEEEVNLAIQNTGIGDYNLTIQTPITEEVKEEIIGFSSLVETGLFGELNYRSEPFGTPDSLPIAPKGILALTMGENFPSTEDLSIVNNIVKNELPNTYVSVNNSGDRLVWNAPAANKKAIDDVDCKLKSAIAIQPLVREAGGGISVNLYGINGGPIYSSYTGTDIPTADIDVLFDGKDIATQEKYQSLMECGTTLNFLN